jgi:hypothetical protein
MASTKHRGTRRRTPTHSHAQRRRHRARSALRATSSRNDRRRPSSTLRASRRRNRRGRARTGARQRSARYWSSEVTQHSNAMDLVKGVFQQASPATIARSISASAEHSTRRKSSPFRSALSMITFYINRAGTNLSATRKRVLMRAKDELRALYGRR